MTVDTADLKVFAWNTKDALDNPLRAKRVVDLILQKQPDVAVLSEAYYPGASDYPARVGALLKEHSYEVAYLDYGDTDGREDRHGYLGLWKSGQEFESDGFREIDLGTRKALKVSMGHSQTGAEADVFGYHGDDRTENSRVEQGRRLMSNVDSSRLTVIEGDFNSMYPNESLAQFYRFVGRLAASHAKNEPGRRPNKAIRIGQMAEGQVLRLYQEYGFIDADPETPENQSTIFNHGLPAAIDHIMVNRKGCIKLYEVYSRARASDHRPIAATIDLMAA